MKVQDHNGKEHDYYSFRLHMTYYMTEHGPHMLYGVLGRRKGEFGGIEEDLLKDFSTPEEAAMYHFELEKQLKAEHEARLERIDRMLEEDEEDMDTVPFAPTQPDAEILEEDAEDALPFPEVMKEVAHVDTEICTSSEGSG